MPITSRFFPQWNLWVERANGRLTLAQAIANKQEEIRQGPMDPDTVLLSDLRSAEIDPEDARQWASWMEQHHPDALIRAAYLVQEPRVTGLMLLVKGSFRQRETEVFHDLESAVRWLGLDPAVCTPAALGLAREAKS